MKPAEPPRTHAFQRSHSIVIAAPPERVFDYVTNPKSWPQWLPSSHQIDCEDRPMGFGDTFHEHWSTRTGPVSLDWLVLAADRPRLWIGLTQTPFMGPIVVQYDFAVVESGTYFTRTLRNPARPKAPTDAMIARMDQEAELGLGNIKADRRSAINNEETEAGTHPFFFTSFTLANTISGARSRA